KRLTRWRPNSCNRRGALTTIRTLRPRMRTGNEPTKNETETAPGEVLFLPSLRRSRAQRPRARLCRPHRREPGRVLCVRAVAEAGRTACAAQADGRAGRRSL